MLNACAEHDSFLNLKNVQKGACVCSKVSLYLLPQVRQQQLDGKSQLSFPPAPQLGGVWSSRPLLLQALYSDLALKKTKPQTYCGPGLK